jgi:parallel beta-helix repeat protein
LQGIDITGQGVVDNCRVSGTTAEGIRAMNGSMVANCAVEGADVGIQTGFGSTVENCNVLGTSDFGIMLGQNSTARGCTITNSNGGITGTSNASVLESTVTDIFGAGILLGDRSLVVNTNASNCSGTGIQVGHRSSVTDCNANENEGGGILIGSQSLVRGCDASLNADPVGNVWGIFVDGGYSRIEGNMCNQNDGPGIVIDGTRNVVVKNSLAFNNGIISVLSGSNTINTANLSTPPGPWDNITH